ncbi:hypothetical protein A3Q56_05992 [Intoshia linei]|uniref:GTPase Era, mitochondrial n=1 Tax=Intoshia linei TaxID=1819745 RepID=A0A177AWB6_9BILA|nr:hypothetical protein A3Q56_05992 [Intoshia linei]
MLTKFFSFMAIKVLRKMVNCKSAKISIIGLPNCGKSTICNLLGGWKFSAVSKKVHTTIKNVKAVVNQDGFQMTLIDTPGLISVDDITKYNLNKEIIKLPEESILEADIVMLIVDVSNENSIQFSDQMSRNVVSRFIHNPESYGKSKSPGRPKKLTSKMESHIIRDASSGQYTARKIIQNLELDVKLRTVQQVDILKEKIKLLDYTRLLTNGNLKCNTALKSQFSSLTEIKENDIKHWPFFDRVFMASAKKKSGIQDIIVFRNYIYENTIDRNENVYNRATNQSEVEIIKNIIREAMLETLPQEIPYTVVPKIKTINQMEDCLDISVSLSCPNNRCMSSLLCYEGRNIKNIVAIAKTQLSNAFRVNVMLKVSAIVDKKNEKIESK